MGHEMAGDCGEPPEEGSVMDDESSVDTVVVGEDSVESEADVEVLLRGWCWKGFSITRSPI